MKIVVIAAVAFVPLYALVANVMLSRQTIAHLASSSPETFRLQYAHAKTWWPGHVHVEGLDLRGRDSNVEWSLHVDSADASLSLLSLLRQHVHIDPVTASGVDFRIRFRLAPEEAVPDRIARIPPIDGFPLVPLLDNPADHSDGAPGKPWTIDIHTIDAATLREVWVDTYRLTGQMHARGGFTLGPNLLEVTPATVEVQEAALTSGAPIVTDVQGNVDARVDALDISAVTGTAVLRYLTMNSSLRGKMGGIAFIQRFLKGSAVTVEGGEGTFQSDVHVVRGLVQKGTESHVVLGTEKIGIAGHRIEARTTLDLATNEDSEGKTTHKVTAVVADLLFTEPGAKTPVARCSWLEAIARVPQVDIADAPAAGQKLIYSWNVPKIEVLDLRAVDEALGNDAGFRVTHGSATVATRGEGTLTGLKSENKLVSNATLNVEGGHLAAGIDGMVPMAINYASSTFDFDGGDLTLRDTSRPDWWGKVKIGTAVIKTTPASASLALSMSARDARPILALYAGMQQTSPVAAAIMRVIPDIMVESMTANLAGGARITASPGKLDVHALDVHGASSRFRMEMAKRGTQMEGGVLIEAGPTSTGVAFTGGSTKVILINATSWFEGGRHATP